MNEKGKATLKICKQKLNYLNYSKNTIKCYLWYIDEFLSLNEQIINNALIGCGIKPIQF